MQTAGAEETLNDAHSLQDARSIQAHALDVAPKSPECPPNSWTMVSLSNDACLYARLADLAFSLPIKSPSLPCLDASTLLDEENVRWLGIVEIVRGRRRRMDMMTAIESSELRFGVWCSPESLLAHAYR